MVLSLSCKIFLICLYLLHTVRFISHFLKQFWVHKVQMDLEILAVRRHGPLLDVSGALWVFLQGLHDLSVVQHESHQLVLPLSFDRRAVHRPDHLQLLQVLKGLRTVGGVSVNKSSLFLYTKILILSVSLGLKHFLFSPSWWQAAQSCTWSWTFSAGTS